MTDFSSSISIRWDRTSTPSMPSEATYAVDVLIATSRSMLPKENRAFHVQPCARWAERRRKREMSGRNALL